MVADVAQLDPGLLVAHDEPAARLEHEIDRRVVHRHPLFRSAVAVLADLDEDRARRHLPRAGEPERLELGFAVRPGSEIVALHSGAPPHVGDDGQRPRMREPPGSVPVLAHDPRQVLLQRRLGEEHVGRFLVDHRLDAGLP